MNKLSRIWLVALAALTFASAAAAKTDGGWWVAAQASGTTKNIPLGGNTWFHKTVQVRVFQAKAFRVDAQTSLAHYDIEVEQYCERGASVKSDIGGESVGAGRRTPHYTHTYQPLLKNATCTFQATFKAWRDDDGSVDAARIRLDVLGGKRA